jgi:hypothetical protein
MPTIQDSSATALLHHLNIDTVGAWDALPGRKLLALPLGNRSLDPTNFEKAASKIFTAIAEITDSQDVAVSDPNDPNDPKSDDGDDGRTAPVPTIYLVYNLLDTHADLLLQRGIWSSTAITFRVTDLSLPRPDFLFTIKGFHNKRTEQISEFVHSVWQSDFIQSSIDCITDDSSESLDVETKSSLRDFLASVHVTFLNIKEAGDILVPHFNIYAPGSKIANDDLWTLLRKFLSDLTYTDAVLGVGTTDISPFYCSLCHGIDHPRGLCPLPNTPGWNGPTSRPSDTNRRGRGGRSRGANARGSSSRGRR